MSTVEVPLVVCVSADAAVRERVVRQLDACGPVLICADLDELRAILFPPAQAEPPPRPEAAPPPGSVVQLGELTVDPGGHRVTWRGRPLPVTRLERRLLHCLASPPQDVWTYQRLFRAVWGSSYLGDTSILHSAVKRLRGKLLAAGPEVSVETVRGVGYRLLIDGRPGS
jgi:two-component system, OmpR family, response regulator MtrA